MIDVAKFKPKTVYVTYIEATPEAVFAALTEPAFTRQYFGGFAIDVEPRTGGVFCMLAPDGAVHIEGRVVDWSPPRRFACTWKVVGMTETRALPDCLVAYDIAPAGGCVRLTMTESHQWEVPDAILSGGRAGWPAILSSLKSVLETGKPLSVKLEPPPEMIEALKAMAHGDHG
jgi:uncharacterized protein YndB with AHSA1/START domain